MRNVLIETKIIACRHTGVLLLFRIGQTGQMKYQGIGPPIRSRSPSRPGVWPEARCQRCTSAPTGRLADKAHNGPVICIYMRRTISLFLYFNEMTNSCHHNGHSIEHEGASYQDATMMIACKVPALPALLVGCLGAIRILSVPSTPRPFWLRLLSPRPWSGNLNSALRIVRLCTPNRSIAGFALYLLLVSEVLQTQP